MAEFAIIKFNGGRGALLCNRCHWVIRQDFDPRDIQDRKYFCEDFGFKCHRESIDNEE